MNIDQKISEAVIEYKADSELYHIENLFFEDGASKHAKKIYEQTKDAIADHNPNELTSYFRFLITNGADIDVEKEARRILESAKSDVTCLCGLAALVTSSAYPEEARCRPDLPELRDEIIGSALKAVNDVYDAKQIVELVGGRYQGLHLGDTARAEQFIEGWKEKFGSSDIKKLKKALKDM